MVMNDEAGERLHGRSELRRIRFWLAVFIIGLILSGVTAFPLETEARLLVRTLAGLGVSEQEALMLWLTRVRDALIDVNQRYPFLPYGVDWLAFAHLAIAAAFIGPWRDPVRNKWVVDFGLIACAGVIPLALIAGHIRGIPLWWRAIDCSFGIFGAIPLLIVRGMVGRLERDRS